MVCRACRKRIPDRSAYCLACGATQDGRGVAAAPGDLAAGVDSWADRWLNRLWVMLGLAATLAFVWYYQPTGVQKRYAEWKAARGCSVPAPGNYVYIRRADFDSTIAISLAAQLQDQGFRAMCGNLYGNSATLVGPYADLKDSNAAFWRLHLTRGPGDYIRLLKVDVSDGGTWSDPYPLERK
jgi:hypothetical protein